MFHQWFLSIAENPVIPRSFSEVVDGLVADVEGSTFRKTAAVARSVFRIRPDESTREKGVSSSNRAPSVERWETILRSVF